jgi:hypothetical protein
MSEHNNFLGIPVRGDITRGARMLDQRPLEEFSPLIQALLDDPYIVEFGWHQYTPYFNDGEPCEFGANNLWVRTADMPEEVEDRDYELEVQYGSVAKSALGERDWRTGVYTGPDEGRFVRVIELLNAIEGGSFDQLLIKAFGDHADITVRRDGITFEFYDHD